LDTQKDWTTLHDLAIVYLALAHGTDAHLGDDELAVMTTRLGDWVPELDEMDVRLVVMEALSVYLECIGEMEVRRSMIAVRHDINMINRFHALDDLVVIAEADGIMLPSEQGMIESLQRIWNIQPSAEA